MHPSYMNLVLGTCLQSRRALLTEEGAPSAADSAAGTAGQQPDGGEVRARADGEGGVEAPEASGVDEQAAEGHGNEAAEVPLHAGGGHRKLRQL